MQFKKMLLLLTAACFTLSGCTGTKKVETVSPETENIQQVDTTLPVGEDSLTTQVRVEEIDLGIEGAGITELFITDGGYGAVTIPEENLDISFREFTSDFELKSDNKLNLPAPQDDFYYTSGYYTYENGIIYSLAFMEWHSGMKPYIYSDDKENFDWDTFNSDVETRYMLCTYSTDGTLISAVNIEGLTEYCPENQYVYDQFSVSNGEVYLTLNTGYILHINKNDGSLKEIYVQEGISEYDTCALRFIKDSNGEIMLFSAVPSHNSIEVEYIAKINEFDLQTGTCGEELYNSQYIAYKSDSGTPVNGYGDYRFCIQTSDYLTGYKYNGETEELIDWAASDIYPDMIQVVGENCFVMYGWGESGVELSRLTRKRQSELKEKTVLELMNLGWDDYNITNIVNNFNRNNNDYRIDVLKNPAYNLDYDDENYQENFEEANRDFTMKLLTDDAPDIVITPDYESISNLCDKGAFVDLYTLMANDSEMNKSTFVPNIIETLESENGALYCLPSSFSISTLMVKSKFHNKENWTVQDMISVYDNAEKDVYKWVERDRMLSLLLDGTDFADEKNGTCSFNSPEFVELLKFCKRFPTELNQPAKNYDSPEQSELLSQFYTDQFHSYQKDENLIYPIILSSHSIGGGYSYVKAMFGEDVTLVGYPSDTDQGSKITTYNHIAVAANCEQKEAAWEFIKEYIKGDNSYIPVTEKEFEATLDSWMKLSDVFAHSGEEYYEDDGLKVYPLNQQEREYIESYIRNSTALLPSENLSLHNIIFEEAEVFFADGRTAEEAAEIIQNRAEILVSEQSW